MLFVLIVFQNFYFFEFFDLFLFREVLVFPIYIGSRNHELI